MCIFYCNICSVKKSLVFFISNAYNRKSVCKIQKNLVTRRSSGQRWLWFSAYHCRAESPNICKYLSKFGQNCKLFKIQQALWDKMAKRANVENLMTKYLERDSVKRCWTTIVFFRNFIMFMLCFFGRLINFWCQTKNVIDFDLCVQLVKKNINNLFLFVLF